MTAAPPSPPAPGGRRARLTAAAGGLAGIIMAAAVWEVSGRLGLLGNRWPPLSDIAAALAEHRDVFFRASRATMSDALAGWLAGLFIGFALALTGHLAPILRRPIGRFATIVNSVPWVALGPLLVVAVAGAQQLTPLIFATLAVFFAGFVSISSGLRASSDAHNDVLTAMGAGKGARLRRLELPAALPSIVYAAKLGAPAAMFGVVFGEWFGSEPPALGLMIANTLRQLQTDLLWASAALTAVFAATAFALLAGLERAVASRYGS